MKKYLFGAMVVGVAFTSCVNDVEADLTAESNAKPISFEVAKYKASSRAGESAQADNGYTEYATNQFFGTFAFYAATTNGVHAPFANEDDVEMQNAKVGYANSVWTALGDTYFWPQTGHLDFVSYSPYSTDATIAVGHINESAKDYNALSITDYTVGTEDLMYSDKAHLQTHNKTMYFNSGVPTMFRHALAKLNFKVRTKHVQTEEVVGEDSKTLYWRVVLNSIKLNGIFNKGSLTLHTSSPSVAGTTQYEIANLAEGASKVWTRANSQVSKEWTSAEGQVLTMVPTNFVDAINYYVLPQTFTVGEQSFTVNYTVQNKVGDTGTWSTPTEFTKTIGFTERAAMVSAWEMGKNITYTLIIDPKGDVITFDPAVADWEEVNGTLDI